MSDPIDKLRQEMDEKIRRVHERVDVVKDENSKQFADLLAAQKVTQAHVDNIAKNMDKLSVIVEKSTENVNALTTNQQLMQEKVEALEDLASSAMGTAEDAKDVADKIIEDREKMAKDTATHQAVEDEKKKNWSQVKFSVITSILTSAILGALIFAGAAVWSAIKDEVKDKPTTPSVKTGP